MDLVRFYHIKWAPVAAIEPNLVDVKFFAEVVLERFPFPLRPFGYGVGCEGPCSKKDTTLQIITYAI